MLASAWLDLGRAATYALPPSGSCTVQCQGIIRTDSAAPGSCYLQGLHRPDHSKEGLKEFPTKTARLNRLDSTSTCRVFVLAATDAAKLLELIPCVLRCIFS